MQEALREKMCKRMNYPPMPIFVEQSLAKDIGARVAHGQSVCAAETTGEDFC